MSWSGDISSLKCRLGTNKNTDVNVVTPPKENAAIMRSFGGIDPKLFHAAIRNKVSTRSNGVSNNSKKNDDRYNSMKLNGSKKPLSWILKEAQHRSKRINNIRDFDEFQRKTHYAEYPLQKFALDNLIALRKTTILKKNSLRENISAEETESNGKKNDENNTDEIISDNSNRKYQRRTCGSRGLCCINERNVKNPLWSKEPRIFAVEKSGGGKRRYICAHLGRFMHHYWRECDHSARHYYELICDGDHCRLYFDLEFSKEANPSIDDDKIKDLLNEFIQELDVELKHTYNINVKRNHVVDLDSSTNSKFSRHLIVHLGASGTEEERLFESAVECGYFVKRFVGRLAEEVSTGDLSRRCPTLADCLFVNTKSTSTDGTNTAIPVFDNRCQTKGQKQTSEKSKPTLKGEYEPNGRYYDTAFDHSNGSIHLAQGNSTSHLRSSISTNKNEVQVTTNMTNLRSRTSCFIDTGVYTRNRLFRLMGSTKWGKKTSAALRISSANEFPFPKKFGNNYFYGPEMNSTLNMSSWQDDDGDFDKHLNWESHASALADTLVVPMNHQSIKPQQILPKILSTSNSMYTNKGFDKITTGLGHFKTIPKHRNHITSKQPYSMESTDSSPFPSLDQFVSSVLGMRNGIQGSIRAWSIEYDKFDQDKTNFASSIITYHMKGNRWCENINRPHKSNNIMWVVSLKCMQYWQSCYDPTCRQESFCGKKNDLPPNVKDSIDDILLEKALKVDEEFENALFSISFQNTNETRQSTNKQSKISTPDDNVDDAFQNALCEALLYKPHLFP